MKILFVYLSWTLIKACRGLTCTHTPLMNIHHVFKWHKTVVVFSSAFDRTLHLKRPVLDHLLRGARAFCEWRSQRYWNFGVIWVWVRFAISTICRDLPAEISASLCIFSFNQSCFPSDLKKGVYLVFASATLFYIYTHIYICLSLWSTVLSCCYTTSNFNLSTGMTVVSSWPPHSNENIKVNTNL